jgi:anaerobic selenocysteine-containing dehydrogenase
MSSHKTRRDFLKCGAAGSLAYALGSSAASAGDTAVIVHISGFGPTGTRYIDAQKTPFTKP